MYSAVLWVDTNVRYTATRSQNYLFIIMNDTFFIIVIIITIYFSIPPSLGVHIEIIQLLYYRMY